MAAFPFSGSKEAILPSSGCSPSRLKSHRKWLSFGALVIILTIYSLHASVLRVLNDELAYLLGEDPPTLADDPHAFRRLWERAATQAQPTFFLYRPL